MRQRPLKVIVKAPFSTYSGYGQDGFGLVRALNRWGCDVYPQPTWLDVPIPKDLLPLFGKTLYGPFDLLINHWDPDHILITREARASARVAVAWSMWEFGPPPEGIKRPCKKHLPCAQCGEQRVGHGQRAHGAFEGTLRSSKALGLADCPDCKHIESGLYPHSKQKSSLASRFRWFDLVLGYDPVSLASFEPFIPAKVHAGILQGGYDSTIWRPVDRDWHGDRFQFLMHGALNARKCPWTAIEAWHKLKAEKGDAFAGARLALHTSAPGTLFPELNTPFAHAGIKVFVSSLDLQGVKDMYAASHCLLAPSRGEGKNLPALEFMSTAGVAAATNIGGHTMWMGGDWAYPLDYTLGATFGDCPWGAYDAKVSVDHLADVIWHIYTHRDEARQKGAKAAELIPKMCDWSVVIENLFRRIRDQVTSNGVGPQVYDLAMGCRVEQDDLGPVMLR